ncbi:radical SAM/SPASM domain-containing protein [Pontibacter sp. G13]|uniref:radical SAM/SPASM domain-containing protein n=1 Tax=Pontibacter sp. G13 TaxID=3074898 RepID=UPI00288AA3BA|nr:radical SAM/SPASM domain-containing protein [Pontibacter sp. G13]WNJ18520.1 radical SAM/SPASM domain-containing protein [Pontibacter sp. G13]
MVHLRKIRLLLGTLTLRKLWNFGWIYLSFFVSKWMRRSWHRGNPVKIGFEPTTFCNLRCPECPSGLRSFTRPTGMAQMDLFRHTVDQLFGDLVYLLLYFQGEPYLNPDFLDMAAYAHQKGIYSATSTNGHYLTPENARKTVESGLSEVIISIDGTTQDTYEAYRIGGNLEKVKQGVANLVEARKAAGSLHPFIVIQFLVVKPNEHQIEAVKEMGQSLGVDQVVFKTAQVYEFKHGNDLIPDNNRYSRYRQQTDGTWTIKNPLDNQCWKLWHGAEITWDGKVLPCCFDKDAAHEMGNLVETPFWEIWRSPAYDAFRNQLLTSRAEIDMCRNCSEGTRVFA